MIIAVTKVQKLAWKDIVHLLMFLSKYVNKSILYLSHIINNIPTIPIEYLLIFSSSGGKF